MAATTSLAQDQVPDWRERTAPQALPILLTAQERTLIVTAMEIVAEQEPLRKTSKFYQDILQRLKSDVPITLNDVILINGPLMMAQRDMNQEQAAAAKVLLKKLRAATAAMVGSQ